MLTSNERIANIAEFQEIRDVVDICDLVLIRCCRWLPKNCRENERLPYGRSRLVHVQLFTVTSRSLETDSLWASINED